MRDRCGDWAAARIRRTPTATKPNGEGKRLSKVNSSGTLKYLYDQSKVAIERDVSNNNLATYTHEGGGLFYDLISVERSNSDYWYLLDGLGSVTELVDSDEDTQNSYRYEAFGQIKSSSENVTNYYKYVGAFGVHHDSALALYFMQARYYKAAIGRFITMDPFPGVPHAPTSLHPYLYVSNSPASKLDVTGLGEYCRVLISGGGGGLGVGGFVGMLTLRCSSGTYRYSVWCAGAYIGAGAGAQFHVGFGWFPDPANADGFGWTIGGEILFPIPIGVGPGGEFSSDWPVESWACSYKYGAGGIEVGLPGGGVYGYVCKTSKGIFPW